MPWDDDDPFDDVDLELGDEDGEDDEDGEEDDAGGWDDEAEPEPPICPWCGATALPVVPEDGDPGFVCETPGCEAYGLRLA